MGGFVITPFLSREAEIHEGKLVIADRGYMTKKPDEQMMSAPNQLDSKVVHNFKSCARLGLLTDG